MAQRKKLPELLSHPKNTRELCGINNRYRLLVYVHWWRLFPYGYWVERGGAQVFFDRNYCPIARKISEGGVEPVHPLERVKWIKQHWFYDDGVAPYIKKQTLPLILRITETNSLQGEIERRWKLSDYGRIDHNVWGKEW